MQGNHNFTGYTLYTVYSTKKANEGICPEEEEPSPLHKGASPSSGYESLGLCLPREDTSF